MRIINIFSISVVLICLSSFPQITLAESIQTNTASHYINNCKKYDKQKIVLRGEAVGEPIKRGDHRWINIYDKEGNIALGVYIEKSEAEKIKHWGDYKTSGDIVDVCGTFFLADPDTNGEMDIQGETISIYSEGFLVPEEFSLWKIIALIVLMIITLGLLLDWFLAVRRRKIEQKQTFELDGIVSEELE